MAEHKGQSYRILFTSVGRRVELMQCFHNAAEEMNIALTIYGADISDNAPALSFCDVPIKICRIKDEAYIPSLLNICKEYEIDLLIPTIDTDLLILAENKEKFAEFGTKVFISSPEMVAYCRDKRHTAELFRKCKLLAPDSFSDVSLYNQGYPAFIKPLDGSSSIDAYKVNSFEELQEYAKRIKGYVIQPYISGTEYTIDIMCDFDGNPIYITPRERVAVRSGEVLVTRIVEDEQIIEESKKLISVFKPCGPITVQLIRDYSGLDYFIEINPRFGGGAPLSMKAGANSAKAALCLLSGKPVDKMMNDVEANAVYSRFDQSICTNARYIKHAGKVTDLEKIYLQYKAVVFDLDDTLYSEKQYVRSGFSKVSELIPQVKDAKEKLWNAFEKRGNAIDEVLKGENIYSDSLKEACLCVYRNQIPEINLYDGVEDMLGRLRTRGIKLGIITDGRSYGQRRKLEKLDLYRMVDEVIITDELAGNGNVAHFRKPATIAFEIMKMRLNVRYEDMIYIGDNQKKDFKAPKRLGMASVYIQNGDGLYKE